MGRLLRSKSKIKNDYLILGDTTILYASNGKMSLVDTKYIDDILQYKFCCDQYFYNTSYPNGAKGKKERLLLSKLVMILNKKYEQGKIVDHLDGNKINNQECNLRMVTKSENSKNTSLQKRSTTGFKGVHKRLNGYYCGWITVNRGRIYLGRSKDPAEIARRYDEIGIKNGFKRLNFGGTE